MPRTISQFYQITEKALIFCFFLIIAVPITFSLFIHNTSNFSESEKRKLTPFPKLGNIEINEIPSELDKFFEDQFPMRRDLIEYANVVRTKWFRQPTEHVVVGKNDWLFFKAENIFEDLTGKLRLEQSEIREKLEPFINKQDLLSELDAGYLLVTIPNKSTIYSDRLPWWIRTQAQETRLQQIYQYNKKSDQLNWLNLEGTLRELKSAGAQAYWPKDSHWSGLGFQAGLTELYGRCRVWFPDLRPSDILEHTEIHTQTIPGDLINLIGMAKQWPLSERLQLEVTGPNDFYLANDRFELPTELQATITIRESGSGTVLVFHDSFFRTAKRSNQPAYNHPIGIGFNTCVSIWKRPSLEEMLKITEIIRPDVVIEERVERLFHEENSM